MHFLSWFTFVNALAIGIVIVCMAKLTNPRLKALVYSLPIPMTIGIIATHGHMGPSNVMGLALVCGFLWLARILYKRGIPILAADILSALAYVAVGYAAVHLVHISFWLATVIYVGLWILFMWRLGLNPHQDSPGQKSGIPVAIKGSLAFGISYILFSLKNLLAGTVVTFPFSGVFAVIETRHHLGILARVMSRNSIAILSMFVTVHVLSSKLPLWLCLAAGWLVYIVILKIVQGIKV